MKEIIDRDSSVEIHDKFISTHVRQTIEAKTEDSFIEYVKRFKVDSTTIFADVSNFSFRCIIDYHDEINGPSCMDHVVNYICPISIECDEWIRNCGCEMDKYSFYDFMAIRSVDFFNESINIEEKLNILINSSLVSPGIRSNGYIKFQIFDSGTNVFSSIDIPEKIKLFFSPFKDGQGYELQLRIRHKVKCGDVKFWYEIIGCENIIEDAFKDIFEKFKELPFINHIYEAKLP